NQQAQVERYRADVQNARAAYAEAKAQTAKAQVAVVDARRDLDRKAELFARQLIARSELDTAQAAHDSAVAQLDSARAHEEAFTGKVVQIRKAAQVLQNVVTYTVVIATDNRGGRLLPGMTANVKLIVGEKANVLKVPNAALRFRPAGARAEAKSTGAETKTKGSPPARGASGGSA